MRTQKISESPDESRKRFRPPYASATTDNTGQRPRVKMAARNDKLELLSALTRHDVRSKLATIRNRVYLAKIRLTAYPEALDDLNDISKTIEEVENVLAFAQIYETLGIEEPSFEKLSDHVNAAIALLPRFRSGASGIRVADETQGLEVLADSMLRHLFYNLFHNSAMHGERVRRVVVRYVHEKDQLKIIYEDDGVGISEEEKERIFLKGYGRGTGYGLFLIRGMCNVYGWDITETGKKGRGAQFTMTMPKKFTRLP